MDQHNNAATAPEGSPAPHAVSFKRAPSPHAAAEVVIAGRDYAGFDQLLLQIKETQIGSKWAGHPTSDWKLTTYDKNSGNLILQGPEGVSAAVPFPTSPGCQLAIIDQRYLLITCENPQNRSQLLPIGISMGNRPHYQLFDIGQSEGARFDSPTIQITEREPLSFSNLGLSYAGKQLRLNHLTALQNLDPSTLHEQTGFKLYASATGRSQIFMHDDGAVIPTNSWLGVISVNTAPDKKSILIKDDEATWKLTIDHTNTSYRAEKVS